MKMLKMANINMPTMKPTTLKTPIIKIATIKIPNIRNFPIRIILQKQIEQIINNDEIFDFEK